MKAGIIITVITFISFSSFAQTKTSNGGIIYGDSGAYSLTAPKGWVLDNKSGVPNGLYAVFYPKGGSWENSETVMYSQAVMKTGKTIDDVIKADADDFTKNDSGVAIKNGDSIIINDTQQNTAYIKYFSGGSLPNYEGVAYIDADKVIVFIVITSRTTNGFERNLSNFKKLIESYIYLGDSINVEKE